MEQIVEWLRKIEQTACNIYADSAEYFKENKALSAFLSRLAEDEALHFHVISSASVCLKNSASDIESSIIVDEVTKSNVEKPLIDMKEAISNGRLTREIALECIGNSERSEWNDIFLYVINSLKTQSREFVYVGPKLQHHLRFIERYLEGGKSGQEVIRQLNAIKPVWDEKILVVDDNGPMLQLLAAVLKKDGLVHTAVNGKDALEMACREYYAVIVSDMDMPVMNGMEFFENMEKKYENVARRFLFVTGDPSGEVMNFMNKKGLPLIPKPFSLTEIRRKIFDIMEKNFRDAPPGEIVSA